MTTALPRALQVEVTGACNLRCRMCLVRYRPALNRLTASLTFETFRRLVDAAPGLDTITLQGLGEPLMAPDLFPMLAYAKARGIRAGFNTNGALLTRAIAEQLLDAGLDWLCVSIDGARRATYESIRDGASFDKVCANVRGFTALMRDRAATHPALSFVFVAMRRNVGELSELVRLAADLGVPTIRVQNLSHSFSDTDPAGDYREIREFAASEALWQCEPQDFGGAAGGARPRRVYEKSCEPQDVGGARPRRVDEKSERVLPPARRVESVAAIFADARATAKALGVALRLPEVEEPPARRERGAPGCDWPWRSAYVRQDGKVQPCCMLMGGDRAILGDVATTPFAEIWDGDDYRAFRAALLSDRPPDVCRGCAMYRGVF